MIIPVLSYHPIIIPLGKARAARLPILLDPTGKILDFPMVMPQVRRSFGVMPRAPDWGDKNMGLSENRVYSQWNSHLIGIMIINHWV